MRGAPLLLALLAGLVLGPATPARAAPRRPPLSQLLKGEALERYEAARQEFKAMRFEQALQGFERAWALSKEPRLRWNAAACLRRLGRNAEALRAVDAYLAEAAAELSTEEVDEATRTQAALQALVATVSVQVSPGDAQLLVDGAGAAQGAVLFLEPGPHTFRVEQPGFVAQERRETLNAGARFEWAVTLAPAPRVEERRAPPAVVFVEAPRPAPPARPRWLPWTVAAGGAALALAGGVLLGVAAAEYERLVAGCGSMCAPTRWAPARDAEVLGVVLASAGGAALLAGLGWAAWWAVGDARAQVALGPGRVTLEVRW